MIWRAWMVVYLCSLMSNAFCLIIPNKLILNFHKLQSLVHSSLRRREEYRYSSLYTRGEEFPYSTQGEEFPYSTRSCRPRVEYGNSSPRVQGRISILLLTLEGGMTFSFLDRVSILIELSFLVLKCSPAFRKQ